MAAGLDMNPLIADEAGAVADSWQRRGLGRRMMGQLVEAARASGLRTMIGDILAENHGMLKLCSSLGFEFVESADRPGVKRAVLALAEASGR